ncbi:apolipoprotein D [Drosophila biarmipes]|uniref:apolipoprotein D n=1 Tax=Drosophila biarmipes TaxID=125945 RepID=UPI0007E749F3|nr:apolipoprotein D [Drosophila biarmipes]
MNHRSNSHLWLLVSIVLSGVCLGNAQVPFPGKCPDVQLLDSFDAEAYMGIWYEYSAYPNTFELGQECVYANYSIVDSSTVSVVNGGISGVTGQATNATAIAKVLGPGQLAVAFYEGQSLTNANYLVLGTDYESYAVVYSCTSITQWANIKFAWILTRERQPSAETIDVAKKILDDNKVSQEYLSKTVQQNCPQL